MSWLLKQLLDKPKDHRLFGFVRREGREEFRLTWNQMIHLRFLVHRCPLTEGIIIADRRTGKERMIEVASWK